MRRLILATLLGMLALVGIATSAQGVTTVARPLGADPTTFNTVIQIEAQDRVVQDLVFPALAERSQETGLPQPYLASWEVSGDGLTYTFTINPEAVWSDGMAITSADVAFTLNAISSDNVQTWRTLDGVEAINVVDDKTFEIVLAAPTCGLFTQIDVPIMPAHKFAADYSDFMTSDFNTNPDISGGPFILTERAVDEFLRFEANDTFFLGRPEIDQLLLQVMVDAQVRVQAMQSGEIDILSLQTGDEASQFMDDARFEVYPFEINGWYVTLFNLADPANPMPAHDDDGNVIEQAPHPILGDRRVRQALIEGWDHEDAVFLTGEGARRLVGPVAPILTSYYDNDLELYPYDPEEAAVLLDEAGWVLNGDVREKDGVPLALELLYISSPPYEDFAAVIADYWTDLGVDVTLTTGEQGALIGDRLGPQNFDAFVITASYPEPYPDALLNLLWNSANDFGSDFSSFVDEEFDGLLADLTTADCSPEARQPIYYRLQEIMHEQVPTDFISTIPLYVVTSARINNFQATTWGWTPWWEVTVED